MKRALILLITILLFAPVIAGCGKPASVTVVEKPDSHKSLAEGFEELIDTLRNQEVEREKSPDDTSGQDTGSGEQAYSAPIPPVEVQAQETEPPQPDFDFNLFRNLATASPDRNVVFSPLSVRIALCMAYNGAGGPAKEALAQILQLEGLSLEEVNSDMRQLQESLRGQDDKVQVEIANSIWSQNEYHFLDDFLKRCTQNYKAEVRSVDFEDPKTVDIINAWVEEATHGKIKELITDHMLIKDNLFALINAIYFKAEWSVQFNEEYTSEAVFHLQHGGETMVPMMNQSREFSYLENQDFQAVNLHYGDSGISMYVFLPREGKGLADLYATLSRENWDSWMGAFTARLGSLFLPRFEMEYEANLVEILKAMGMGPACEGNALPNMSSASPLAIKHVLHKSFIGVNEAGTEGAASTYIGIIPICPAPSEQKPFTMRVDRPFVFAIRDNQTGALLFMGSIVDPT